MLWNTVLNGRRAAYEWHQKRKLREMLTDPRSTKGFR
jgi:hypothetical protein